MQAAMNPGDNGPEIQRFGWTFRIGDRVIQTETTMTGTCSMANSAWSKQ
jgi:hypothetical protein